jgi:orotidine-5'-phosphate decarboxylase
MGFEHEPQRRIATASDRLVFALDVATLAEARELIDRLHRPVGVFKVGLELFSAAGPSALEAVHASGRRSFLDLKLHDIPATVQRAVQAALTLGASYLTVHAAVGAATMRAAVAVAAGTNLKLLAVTVLTSADDALLASIGVSGSVSEAVARLARLAADSGMHGLVCAPAECATLRALVGPDLLLVSPGVRPTGSSAQDQDPKRLATPAGAIAAGADLLVVGRPIRDALDPRRAAESIVEEIAAATDRPSAG